MSSRWRLFNLPGTQIWKEALLALWAPWLVAFWTCNSPAYGSSCLWFHQMNGMSRRPNMYPICIYHYIPAMLVLDEPKQSMLDYYLDVSIAGTRWYRAVPGPFVALHPRWSGHHADLEMHPDGSGGFDPLRYWGPADHCWPLKFGVLSMIWLGFTLVSSCLLRSSKQERIIGGSLFRVGGWIPPWSYDGQCQKLGFG